MVVAWVGLLLADGEAALAAGGEEALGAAGEETPGADAAEVSPFLQNSSN